MNLPPLSLYIHYPWCEKKCPYCDFNSHKKIAKYQNYTQALLTDLDQHLLQIKNRKLHSIFIGGGTPSLLTVNEVQTIVNAVGEKLEISDDVEITLEANPSSSEVEKFSAFKQIGVNRLSIGVQSFNDKELQTIGRIHNSNAAKTAIKAAQDAEFDAINIDLMYGMPCQDKNAILTNLEQAIALKPSHISHYQFSIEPNTYFAKYPPLLPNEEVIFESEQLAKQHLKSYGYPQYEISAYGKVKCKHNLNYWQFGDYLGIGAGACGKISLTNGDIIRSTKIKSPIAYQQNQTAKYTKITAKQLIFEFMLNALRLKDGFDIQLFESRTNLEFSNIREKIKLGIDKGLLLQNGSSFVATKLGFNFLNNLQSLFLNE